MNKPIRAEHWEPPDPPKLLVSARRVAKELDIQIWKAQQLCYSLGRIYYTDGGHHYRVPWKSLQRFKFLMEDVGMSFSEAQTTMYRERNSGDGEWTPYNAPPMPKTSNPWGLTDRSWAYHQRHKWR